MLQFHRFWSNFLRKWFQQLLCTEIESSIYSSFYLHLVFISNIWNCFNSSSIFVSSIQNTNSLNWEKIFCFAKEFTKVTWHLRHAGFNRIRQLIFHDYMSYRKINCIMPAKQTPHTRHTIHKRALKTIYFPPPTVRSGPAAKMKYFNLLCPPGGQLYSSPYDQTWQCVGWHLVFVKF